MESRSICLNLETGDLCINRTIPAGNTVGWAIMRDTDDLAILGAILPFAQILLDYYYHPKGTVEYQMREEASQAISNLCDFNTSHSV